MILRQRCPVTLREEKRGKEKSKEGALAIFGCICLLSEKTQPEVDFTFKLDRSRCYFFGHFFVTAMPELGTLEF